MLALNRTLAILATLFSAIAYGHSAMFDDYFVFDDTNEGVSAAEYLRKNPGLVNTDNCTEGRARGYLCKNVDLKAFVPKADLGGGSSANLNDIWGWVDPVTGHEIAIIGLTNGTSFVDISKPTEPVVIGFLPSRKGGKSVWRDIKVYADHGFIVADAYGNRRHGLQVFDLNQLRDTTPGSTLSETAGLSSFGSAHNIAINEETGFAYVVGSKKCSGGLYMVDISDPSNPFYAGCFSSDGYTHDTQCVVYKGPDSKYSGKEICMGYNEDSLTIVDVTDKANPYQISRTEYKGSAYTHQGWLLNDEHSILLLNDELDEKNRRTNTTSYIWDISDLDRPRQLGNYVGPTAAIDHNLYTKDDFVFETNYRAGLRILSTNQIQSGTMSEVAYFDTIPGSNSAQFSGTWSSYIWFESGNIILSDIGAGLFVVKPDWSAIKKR
ncbi:MAG: choice-of-anchor B family protein [Oligoflexales bacterium]|nr:choice-of-anchor B family protein [Oligoflexales bacterium]